jgi:hypothetical protein
MGLLVLRCLDSAVLTQHKSFRRPDRASQVRTPEAVYGDSELASIAASGRPGFGYKLPVIPFATGHSTIAYDDYRAARRHPFTGTGCRLRVDAVTRDLKDSVAAEDSMTTAMKAHDVYNTRLTCRQVTEPLTIDLSSQLPTPDPDLTNVLQALVNDGNQRAHACNGLADGPPDESHKRAGDTAFENLELDLKTAD